MQGSIAENGIISYVYICICIYHTTALGSARVYVTGLFCGEWAHVLSYVYINMYIYHSNELGCQGLLIQGSLAGNGLISYVYIYIYISPHCVGLPGSPGRYYYL